jgi:hypothetical protein
MLATRLVRPARRWQMRWAEVIVGVVILVGFLGIVALGYTATANRYENVIIETPPVQVAPGMSEPEAPPVLVPGGIQEDDAAYPPAEGESEIAPTPTPAIDYPPAIEAVPSPRGARLDLPGTNLGAAAFE